MVNATTSSIDQKIICSCSHTWQMSSKMWPPKHYGRFSRELDSFRNSSEQVEKRSCRVFLHFSWLMKWIQYNVAVGCELLSGKRALKSVCLLQALLQWVTSSWLRDYKKNTCIVQIHSQPPLKRWVELVHRLLSVVGAIVKSSIFSCHILFFMEWTVFLLFWWSRYCIAVQRNKDY